MPKEFPSGLKPLPYDRRDYDLHRTFGAAIPPVFPENYSVENGLWTPDQSVGGEIFNLPPMPTGCTNYTTCDVCADDDGQLYDPAYQESIVHANARGGVDVRESLGSTLQDKYGKKVRGLRNAKGETGFYRTAYFNIQPTPPLDFFDSIRLAMLVTKEEGRSVSAGTPWFPEFVQPVQGSGGGRPHVGADGILPTPTNWSLEFVSWHNWKIAGWKTINGVSYLIGKPWCGKKYGDKGFCYVSRELANKLFNISGSCAFTISKLEGLEPQQVPFDLVPWLLSIVNYILGLDKPKPPITPPAPVPEPPKPEPPKPDPNALLTLMTGAIQTFEGWWPGSVSYINKNPGNLKFANQAKAIGKDARGFAVFATVEDGLNALKTLITRAARGQSSSYRPDMSLKQFFGVYAPTGDNNAPDLYAKFVAGKMGVSVDFQIRNLV